MSAGCESDNLGRAFGSSAHYLPSRKRGRVRGGPAPDPSVAPRMASPETVTGADLKPVTVTRPGEMFRSSAWTYRDADSGEGKANPYFLRGYNLRSRHRPGGSRSTTCRSKCARTAHGRASDLNLLMTETVNSLEIAKARILPMSAIFGPAARFNPSGPRETEPHTKTASLTVGSFGYSADVWAWPRLRPATAICSWPASSPTTTDRGQTPTMPARSMHGGHQPRHRDNGCQDHGHAYANKWNSTDQVPWVRLVG